MPNIHITTYFIIWIIAASFVLSWSKELLTAVSDAVTNGYILKVLPIIAIFVVGFGWWSYTAIMDIQGPAKDDSKK